MISPMSIVLIFILCLVGTVCANYSRYDVIGKRSSEDGSMRFGFSGRTVVDECRIRWSKKAIKTHFIFKLECFPLSRVSLERQSIDTSFSSWINPLCSQSPSKSSSGDCSSISPPSPSSSLPSSRYSTCDCSSSISSRQSSSQRSSCDSSHSISSNRLTPSNSMAYSSQADSSRQSVLSDSSTTSGLRMAVVALGLRRIGSGKLHKLMLSPRSYDICWQDKLYTATISSSPSITSSKSPLLQLSVAVYGTDKASAEMEWNCSGVSGREFLCKDLHTLKEVLSVKNMDSEYYYRKTLSGKGFRIDHDETTGDSFKGKLIVDKFSTSSALARELSMIMFFVYLNDY